VQVAGRHSFNEWNVCRSRSYLGFWEIKLAGYRALAVKSASGLTLFSQRKKSLNRKFPYIVEPLADLPDGPVVDGELVGLDDSGRPDFNLLQNFPCGSLK
jgi:ATP-dependent DNA ligase